MRSVSEESKQTISTRLLRSTAAREEMLRSCVISQREVELLRRNGGPVDGVQRGALGWFGAGQPLVSVGMAIEPSLEKNLRARAAFKDLEDLIRRGRGRLRLDIQCSRCSTYDQNEREWIYVRDANFHGISIGWVNCRPSTFNGTDFGYVSYLFERNHSAYVVADPAINSMSLAVLDWNEVVLSLPIFSREQTIKLFDGLVKFIDGLDKDSPLRDVLGRVSYMRNSYAQGYYPGVNIEDSIRRKRPRPPIPIDEF